MTSAADGGLLSIALSAAVPLRIMALQRQGGPTEDDYRRAGAFGQVLAEKGDVLLYGNGPRGAREGEPTPAELFNRLAEALSVLAFLPGGVKVFGAHYTAAP